MAEEDINMTAYLLWAFACMLLCCLPLIVKASLERRKNWSLRRPGTQHTPRYSSVEPIPNFDWRSTEPVKLRPFKTKYHLSMGLENISLSELIEMDKTYLERIQSRRSVMHNYSSIVLGADEAVRAAVAEFYEFLFGVYLPTRFPRMFELVQRPKGSEPQLHSLVTDEFVPILMKVSTVEGLRVIGGWIDEDCFFLLPSDDADGYTLKGFITCFPSGYDPSKRLNMKLRDIHKPVPSYGIKLGKSVDRYFEKIPVGKFVKRANWTIADSEQLFRPDHNHLYDGDKAPSGEVDVSQVLHRLPKTKALLLSFKTYLDPIANIKGEGLGEDLAQAIDGLKSGSVPKFYWYKRAIHWGEPVKAYLRNT